MKTRYLSTLLLLLLGFVPVVSAQGPKSPSSVPDFTGRWISESVKARTDPRPQMGTSQGVDIELVVAHSQNEITIKEKATSIRGKHSREMVYYLDGRGESNKGFTDGFVYKTKTEIKNQKLLIEGTVLFPNSQGSSTYTEKWELSADGKTLTIKTKTSGNSVIHYEKVFRLES